MTQMFRVLLMVVILFLWSGPIYGEGGRLPCGSHPTLLRTRKGEPVWFSSKQLKERALTRIDPKLPPSVRVQGTITVVLMIEVDGRVKCAKARRGHPLLRRATEEAAKQWTFKPIEVKDKPVAVVGFLVFHFSN